MSLLDVPAGRQAPSDINVIIEIPVQHDPIKYEVDKQSGALFVDRFLSTSMRYPCNYGYMPQTLSEDGDPVDVLVLTPFLLQPGVVIRSRPIGLMRMTDEAGPDAKILAVPVEKVSPLFSAVSAPEDLPPLLLEQISHFFAHYKDLEAGKWVKVSGFEGVAAAHAEILDSIRRYHAAGG